MGTAVAKYVIELVGKDAGLKQVLGDVKSESGGANSKIVSFAKGASLAGAALAGVATTGAAVVTTMHNVAIATARQARELEAQAVAANLTVQSLQEIGYATQTVGIDANKAADIFKDWQDKLGDFRSTGAGEFADFFEHVGDKVGLTADELARMAGPDALIAVKNAMDQANVSADRQIFYLESLADDASKLTPLLENNGAQLRQMVNRYRDLDGAITDSQITKFKEYEQDVIDMGIAWDSMNRQVVYPFVGMLADGARWMTEIFGTSRQEKLTNLREEMGELAEEIKDLEVNGKKYGGGITGMMDALSGNTGTKGERIAMRKSRINQIKGEIEEIETLMKSNEIVSGYKPPEGLKGGVNLNEKDRERLETLMEQGEAYLQQLDIQFANENQKFELQHQGRLDKIEALQLSEEEIKARGYETLDQLQADYIARSEARMQEQLEAQQLREDERTLADFERIRQDLLTKEQIEQEAWQRREDVLQNTRDRGLIDEARYHELSLKNWDKYQKKLAEMETKRQQQQLNHYKTLFGDLSGLAKVFAGEQSGIYKALFLAQKGFSIASILLSNKEALAKAWASAPFPENLPAVAITAAETGVLSAAAQAITYHTGGIAGLPSDDFGQRLRSGEISAVLERGEEVLTASDPRHRNNLVVGGGSGGRVIEFNQHNHFYNDGSVDSETEGDDSAFQAMADRMAEVTRQTINEEQMPGGLLFTG